MANEQNLIPNSQRTREELREITRKGGIASGKARRLKKTREERMRFIFDLALTNPKIIKNLESLGIDPTDMDNETAMDARMMLEALKGNVNAWKAMKDEGYGMKVQQTKTEMDLSGEIKGININVKEYKEKDGTQH